MALLLAGLPKEVPGTTFNRLGGSSMDAVRDGPRAAIKCDEADLANCRGRREHVAGALCDRQGG